MGSPSFVVGKGTVLPGAVCVCEGTHYFISVLSIESSEGSKMEKELYLQEQSIATSLGHGQSPARERHDAVDHVLIHGITPRVDHHCQNGTVFK